MAYYTLHAYDADVRVPEFLGLRQDDEMATDLRFAADAENVETINGSLQPQAGCKALADSFESKIETLMQFHRRWCAEEGSKDWLIAAVDGKLYAKQKDDEGPWLELEMPTGVDSFQSNVWSWVTYEQTTNESTTVDVLLISNAVDGMYMITPPDRNTTWNDLKSMTWQQVKAKTWREIFSPAWHITAVDTNGEKFGVIERHAERVWGGAIDGKPDVLMYSAVYDPTDWNENAETPEEGAGEVQQPTWDGDSFTTLRNFGDQLIAFKGHHVWRVMGISPGNYVFTEQYGGGSPFPNTVAIERERMFFAERSGISIYDGTAVTPFNRGFIEKVWKKVNPAAMDQMCAVVFDHRYYLAVPIDGSEVNNALIVFDTVQGTFLFYTDIYIESLLASDDKLYATSSVTPGKILEIGHDSWGSRFSAGKHAKWETPWMDFNYKTIAKGGYEIYFNPEVKGKPVTFRFTIRTEKKEKTKEVTILPTTFQQKQKRIRFGGTSRRFKLIVEVLPHLQDTVWRLTGGIHMVVETDPD